MALILKFHHHVTDDLAGRRHWNIYSIYICMCSMYIYILDSIDDILQTARMKEIVLLPFPSNANNKFGQEHLSMSYLSICLSVFLSFRLSIYYLSVYL